MPDLTTETNYLDISLQYPFSERLSARLLCRFQKEHSRLALPKPGHHPSRRTPSPSYRCHARLAAPQDYSVHWFGVMIRSSSRIAGRA